MEHVSQFDTLLKDTVNLPKGKLKLLEERVDSIYDTLDYGDLGTEVLDKKPQGSWAQKTIINPPKGVEFDADFMLELEEQPGWTPKDYNDAVHQALAVDAVYSKMPLTPKNRCVRVTYANDMHVDVVPYVNRKGEGECIINAETDDWEANDADGFTDWMKKKDAVTKKHMRQVIRLLKYLRDHRGWFEDTVSIILTTAVGNTIDEQNVLEDPDCYANVPKTLGRVVADLATWAGGNPTVPKVEAQPSTTFHHRWEDSEYQQFRTDIRDLDAKIQAALKATDEDDSLTLWRALFGTGFKSSDSDSKPSKFPATTGGAAGAGAGSDDDDDSSGSRSGKVG